MDLPVFVIVLTLAVLVVAALVALRWRKPPRIGEIEPTAAPQVGLGAALRRVWALGPDEETWEQLEEILLAADVGVGTTERAVERVREARPETLDAAREALAGHLMAELADRDRRRSNRR